MNLVEIHEQQTWDTFVSAQPFASFTQSWAWGEFQQSLGHVIRRFQLQGNQGEILLAAQMIYFRRRGWSGYWFAPRGPVYAPVMQAQVRSITEAFLTSLMRFSLPGKKLFYRFEPLLTLEQACGQFPLVMRRTHALNPATIQRIDLQKTEEELLSQMHEKTRYNIRLAARKQVQIRIGNADDVETFLRALRETGTRQNFYPHDLLYIRATYEFFAKHDVARLRIAEHAEKFLAGSLEIMFGDTVTYLHGASFIEHRQKMGPYALHWDAIQSAKREGYRWYDLGGRNPELHASFYYKPSWEGITRFKAGWGGEVVHWIGTWDLPMSRFLYALVFPRSVMR